MPRPLYTYLLAMSLFAAAAWGQSNQRTPHLGYLYPAGGRQGTAFQVLAGGQFLRGASDAYVSGTGVRASVVAFAPPMNNQQLGELRRRLAMARQKRLAELPPPLGGPAGRGRPLAARLAAASAEVVALPDDPRLRNLENMSLPQLQKIADEFLDPKRQPNAQIGETAFLQITIDPGAPPGDREVRLGGPNGLTNPLRFQVGTLPEVSESEPNDRGALALTPLDPPCLLNGQIRPGDADRFRFRARRGQDLMIEAEARRLVPYLADAVPGWFQATLALYDARGKEVAFADDHGFDPDPVLFYKVPEDGEYQVEIRDALYRGREDFVYRMTVKPRPVRRGETALSARNPRADGTPECSEDEPNETAKKAQRIVLPRTVVGRIARPGDVDVFRFDGRAGEDFVAEVVARSLSSPLDSLLRLTDASGRVLEWNDDHESQANGLETHHADSYLRARLPRDGVYSVQLSDAQRHGGPDYAYRLRLGPPQPDFALRITPASLSLRAGLAVPITAHALRKDGFDGAIDLVLAGAPPGFTLSGGRIPAGRDSVRMTLSAPRAPLNRPVVLRLLGRARIGGETVVRPAVPAEDLMQAFAYRHLVPAQELMVAVLGGGRRGPAVELAEAAPIRIPASGTAHVRIRAPQGPMLQNINLELSDPPKGVTLSNVSVVPGGLALVLAADGAVVKAGFADNLIVEAFMETAVRRPNAGATAQRQRVSLGVLPAIPIEIVRR